jgi:putative spermidine/putrescine transport system permease protein
MAEDDAGGVADSETTAVAGPETSAVADAEGAGPSGARVPARVGSLRRVALPVTETGRTRRRIVTLTLPFVALAVVGGLYPLAILLRISVSEATFVAEGFSLAAWAEIGESILSFTVGGLRDWGAGPVLDALDLHGTTYGIYGEVLRNTVSFALATTLASLAVAIPVAHALEKYDLPARNAIVTLLAFPISLPGIVAAFMIFALLGNQGLVTNFVAAMLGADPPSIALATTVAGLFLAYLYSMIPRALLLLQGTYAEVNTDAEAAARALGATPWQTFRYVTFPQIKPGVIGAFVLTFRTALAIFGTLVVISALNVWTFKLNRLLENGYEIQYAGALGMLWFASVLAFTFVGLRYTSAEVGI